MYTAAKSKVLTVEPVCLQMYQCCQLMAELFGQSGGKVRLLREKYRF
jgi:hypothetical protein